MHMDEMKLIVHKSIVRGRHEGAVITATKGNDGMLYRIVDTQGWGIGLWRTTRKAAWQNAAEAVERERNSFKSKLITQ